MKQIKWNHKNTSPKREEKVGKGNDEHTGKIESGKMVDVNQFSLTHTFM